MATVHEDDTDACDKEHSEKNFAVQHAHLRNLIAEADAPAMEALFAYCREVRREHDAILNPLPRLEEDAS